jgi:hypothetical protein
MRIAERVANPARSHRNGRYRPFLWLRALAKEMIHRPNKLEQHERDPARCPLDEQVW